jgi:transglutaminase-like putative cysteine protease
VHCFALEDGHQKLSITAISKVEVAEPTAEMTYDDTPWEQVRERLAMDRSAAVLDAYQFTFASPHVPLLAELADYAAPSFPSGAPLTPSVLDLTRRIHADFVYDSTATTISTPLDEVLALRRGVCQDFAQLQIGCLRSLGLAARYVSGYLLTTPPPGRKKLRGADASHAWLSVYLPSGHWLDVDPTNDLIPSDSHITLAWGRDYSDVCPIKGVFVGGGQHSMSVAVDVTAVDGEPDSY